MGHFDNYKFRCHALGKLMTAPRDKKSAISKTTQKYLRQIWIQEIKKRTKDISNKYIEKGLQVEGLAITRYCLSANEYLDKNEQRIENQFIQGEPDVFHGDEIMKATIIVDAKACWDIFTFYDKQDEGIDKDYWWQLQGYMAITGAQKAILAYALEDTPQALVDQEKSRLKWSLGVIDPDGPDPVSRAYRDGCEAIDCLSTYEDLSDDERLFKQPVDRDEEAITELYAMVPFWRKYLNNL
jgi:hypothetical protein